MKDVNNHNEHENENENEPSNELEDYESNHEEYQNQDKTISDGVVAEGHGQNLDNENFEETFHAENGLTYHIMKTDIIKGTK